MTELGTRAEDRPIPAVLQEIVAAARRRVESLRRATSIGALESQGKQHPKRSLRAALEKASPAILAEIKKASPSKGVFSKDFDPEKLAEEYQEGGTAAFSVVTEPVYFQGSTGWIQALREMSHLPILRKDFIIDPIQVAESAAAGADSILLIARILSLPELSALGEAARGAGLEVLYEAHDAADLQKIAPLHPELVGINARNLDDFTISVDLFESLSRTIPATALSVAESGLESHEQIRRLMSFGYRGFLVGETLIRAEDPAATLRRLRGDSQ